MHGTTQGLNELVERGRVLVCHTLVDITATRVVTNYRQDLPQFIDHAGQTVKDQTSWNTSRNQQRNYETVIQIISLRAQPIYLETPSVTVCDLVDFNFGSEFKGKQRVWCFKFAVEHAGVFDIAAHDLAALLNDVDRVPCITGLTESAKFTHPVFVAWGHGTNICFSNAL
jgi:hypothetical protein